MFTFVPFDVDPLVLLGEEVLGPDGRGGEVPGGGEGGARQQHQPPGGQQQRGQARRGHHSASQSSLFVGDKALGVLVIR